MKLSVRSEGKRVRIDIGGDVDEIGAEELEKVFREIDAATAAEVVLNLKNVGYIGSAGVGMMLLLYKRLAPHNGRVIVEKIPRDIYRLLNEDMNLGQVLTLSSA